MIEQWLLIICLQLSLLVVNCGISNTDVLEIPQFTTNTVILSMSYPVLFSLHHIILLHWSTHFFSMTQCKITLVINEGTN